MRRTAWSKWSVLLARAAALMAPAEVPLKMSNGARHAHGHRPRAGPAMACSTPPGRPRVRRRREHQGGAAIGGLAGHGGACYVLGGVALSSSVASASPSSSARALSRAKRAPARSPRPAAPHTRRHARLGAAPRPAARAAAPRHAWRPCSGAATSRVCSPRVMRRSQCGPFMRCTSWPSARQASSSRWANWRQGMAAACCKTACTRAACWARATGASRQCSQSRPPAVRPPRQTAPDAAAAHRTAAR